MSAKQIRRWRPACRPQTRWIRGVLSLQMGENLLDDRRIFDAGNDPHRPTAGTAGFNVDVEHPFQALRPGHRCPALSGGWFLPLAGLLEV